MSGAESRALGRWGEAQAADWLEKRGCVLVAANWRCRFGEIDLIAEDGDFLCFVEVKLRRSSKFSTPREAVTPAKQHKLRQTALMYLAETGLDCQPRFDVAEVYLGTNGIAQIEYYEDAFQ